MLLGTLGASLLENILTGKELNKAEDGVIRAGYGKKISKRNNKKTRLWKQNGFLMARDLLTNFEIQNYYQNEPRFNGVYSRDNLQKKKRTGHI